MEHKTSDRVATSLKAVFGKDHGRLVSHDIICINNFAFKNCFSISVFQQGVRHIEVSSKVAVRADWFWTVLYDIVRLFMLFEGEFLELRTAEYYLGDVKADWSDNLVNEKRCNMLAYYESADYTKAKTWFACPLDYLSETLMENWVQVESELQLIHPMVLYGMSSLKFPIDLKTAILIEAFEPFFEFIKKYSPEFSMAPKQQKSNGEKDSELRRILEAIILKYGTKIFEKEICKDLSSLCQVLVNSRNRLFHIKTRDKKIFLNGNESLLYAAKLSMLYRRILLDVLNIDYNSYSKELNESTKEWDQLNGILDFFIATRWTD